MITNKNKCVQQRQQRQLFFAHIKTFKKVEIVGAFLYPQNLFVKKINWLEIVLITLFYYATNKCYYFGSYP